MSKKMLSRKNPLQSLVGNANTISPAGNIGRACLPDVPTEPMIVISLDTHRWRKINYSI